MAEREAVYWRLPPGLYQQIKDRAADRGVSANQQAVELLEHSLGFGYRTSTSTQPAVADLATAARSDPR